MRTIDADRLLSERMMSTYYHLPNGDTAIPIIDIEHAPTVSAEPKWIPISEKMPKKAGNYLVTDHKGDIARYIFLDSESSKDYWMRCVKAWMPLPTPYREG